MNFTELYQRIRSIEEGAPSEPTAPGGVIKTKNADGTFSYKPKVPGERLSSTLPANQAAKTTDKTDNTKKEPTPANESLEECGDMPMPNGMMGMRNPEQQDSISANISMNASGTGGIRDLMSILRNIENGDDAHGSDEHDMAIAIGGMDKPEPLLGMDEAESGGFDQATTAPDPQTAPTAAAFPTGNDMHSKGGNERPKVNGGGNPYAMAAESLIPRLSSLYQEVKSR